MSRYTTIADVIRYEILPALGSDADNYNAEGIARETYTWKVDTDDDGTELVDTAGFEQTVDTDEFWAIVARYATPVDPWPDADVHTYTVTIECSSDGEIWQAMTPRETVTDRSDDPAGIAGFVANNQTIAEGRGWRVRVWRGTDVDVDSDEPAAEFYADDDETGADL